MTTYAPVAALLALVALVALVTRDVLHQRRIRNAWRQRPWPGRDGGGL